MVARPPNRPNIISGNNSRATQMPRYFLHIKRGAHLVRDHEGSVLPSADEAHVEAIQAAREICAEAIKSGNEVKADAVLVVDEAGSQVSFLPITAAIPQRFQREESADSKHSKWLDNFHKARSQVDKMMHLQGEIEQQVLSCRSTIGEILRQLSAI
jgi:hypothetical protein